jgi:hypothetical protein
MPVGCEVIGNVIDPPGAVALLERQEVSSDYLPLGNVFHAHFSFSLCLLVQNPGYQKAVTQRPKRRPFFL